MKYRTSFLTLFLFLVLHLSSGVAFAQWAAPDAWPQFRGNPLLTGVSKTDVPKNIRLLWTYEAGEAIESSEAIADGTVFAETYTRALLDAVPSEAALRRTFT